VHEIIIIFLLCIVTVQAAGCGYGWTVFGSILNLVCVGS